MPEPPAAGMNAADPEVYLSDPEDPEPWIDYHWSGRIDVPELKDSELCLLVEGARDVDGAACSIWIDGRPVRLARSGSAGQFGAAVDASPENWNWFLGQLPAGEHDFAISVSLPAARAAVGVFLRGHVPADSDDAPKDAIAFPLFQPDQRPWSQTLQPLKVLGREPAGDAAH
jgi:hypothetical protein